MMTWKIDTIAPLGTLSNGGPGSGDFGHYGRPGEVGGSASSGSPTRTKAKKAEHEKKAESKTTTKISFKPEGAKPFGGEAELSEDMKKSHKRVVQDFEQDFYVDTSDIEIGLTDGLAQELQRRGNFSGAFSILKSDGTTTSDMFGPSTVYISQPVADGEEVGQDNNYFTNRTAEGILRHEFGHVVQNSIINRLCFNEKKISDTDFNEGVRLLGSYMYYKTLDPKVKSKIWTVAGVVMKPDQMSKYGGESRGDRNKYRQEAISESLANPNYSTYSNILYNSLKEVASAAANKEGLSWLKKQVRQMKKTYTL